MIVKKNKKSPRERHGTKDKTDRRNNIDENASVKTKKMKQEFEVENLKTTYKNNHSSSSKRENSFKENKKRIVLQKKTLSY